MPFEQVVLETSNGFIRGKIRVSARNNKSSFISFQGIPYGEPPIGDLRFKVSKNKKK